MKISIDQSLYWNNHKCRTLTIAELNFKKSTLRNRLQISRYPSHQRKNREIMCRGWSLKIRITRRRLIRKINSLWIKSWSLRSCRKIIRRKKTDERNCRKNSQRLRIKKFQSLQSIKSWLKRRKDQTCLKVYDKVLKRQKQLLRESFYC